MTSVMACQTCVIEQGDNGMWVPVMDPSFFMLVNCEQAGMNKFL